MNRIRADQIEINESERQLLAEAFDRAAIKALFDGSEQYTHSTIFSPNGMETLRRCAIAFKRMDRPTHTWLTEHGVSLTTYYSTLADYLVKQCHCKSMRKCRSMLKAIFRNPVNQRAVIAYMVGKREEVDKNKLVLRSLLLSITRLCEMTFNTNRVNRPSDVLRNILHAGSLGRYLGGTLSYHFMSLVPNIREVLEGGEGSEDVMNQVDFKNVNKTVMGDEYITFYELLPQYKQEAVKACESIAGNPIVIKGILPFTDEYYVKKYIPEHSVSL